MNKLLLTTMGVASVISLQAKTTDKPNILLIYTDDHRYTGIHALGGEDVKTPTFDALANSGVVFEHAYLQGAFAGATSMPSRAMLMTGRNLFELDGAGHNIPTNQTTIGEALMGAGYYAYHIGKWHQDTKSLARSYNGGAKVVGMPAYLTDQYRMPYSDWNAEGSYPQSKCYMLEYDTKKNVVSRPMRSDELKGPIADETKGPHVSEVLVDDAINFIKDYKQEQPFYMYLAIPCPHDPRQSPKEYRNMYPAKKVTLPPSHMSQHPFDNGHMVLRDEELAPWPRTEEVAKQHLGDYYGIITHLDAEIGRVIEELKKSGMYENTIIVMAGDSGLAVGNHGLIGKQNVYDEDGVHIPLIFSGGALSDELRGGRKGAFCYNYDIMPTICDMVGIEIPESVTGKSLKPVIEGEKESVRNSTYHAYFQFQRAYREGDYKLIEYVRAPGWTKADGDYVAGSRVTQLFNIAKDPWESQDLSFFPDQKERVAQMREAMRKEAMAVGDYADGKRTQFDFWNYYNN